MDDSKHGEYARAPEIEDLIAVCQALNDAKVDYVLIGGLAVGLHGFPRATKDIDFLVDSSVKNIKKIKKALAYLPEKAILELEDDDIEKNVVVRVADEIVIDLMAKACGVTCGEAQKDADIFEIDGTKIVMASAKTLLKTKDTVRPHDKRDAEFLRAKIAAEKNLK